MEMKWPLFPKVLLPAAFCSLQVTVGAHWDSSYCKPHSLLHITHITGSSASNFTSVACLFGLIQTGWKLLYFLQF